jgi:hypothetical protein
VVTVDKEKLREMIRQGKPLVASQGNIKDEKSAQPKEGVKIRPHNWGF